MKKIYIQRVNCKGKRSVGKANKGINVEEKIIDFKKLETPREHCMQRWPQ